MKINAWSVIACWAFIITFLILVLLANTGVYKNAFIGSNSLYLFGLTAFVHIVLATYLKCPNCGKRPTLQGSKAVHLSAKKIKGINAWSVVVLNIVSKGKFTCIHCGEDYHV